MILHTSRLYYLVFHSFVVKLNFFTKFFLEHYQGVQWFGSRSGRTFHQIGPLIELFFFWGSLKCDILFLDFIILQIYGE